MSKLFKIKDKDNNTLLMEESIEYFAPEVLNSTKNNTNNNSNEANTAFDWWTYGIILYELLFNIPLCFNEDANNIKEQIIKNELKFPKGTSKGAKEL